MELRRARFSKRRSSRLKPCVIRRLRSAHLGTTYHRKLQPPRYHGSMLKIYHSGLSEESWLGNEAFAYDRQRKAGLVPRRPMISTKKKAFTIWPGGRFKR